MTQWASESSSYCDQKEFYRILLFMALGLFLGSWDLIISRHNLVREFTICYSQ